MALLRAFEEHFPTVGKDVFLADNASVIGDVQLGPEVSVWYGAVLRGDVGRIRIGARSNIQDNVCVHMTYQNSDTLIGDDVIVGHNAVLHGAIIDHRALIGMNAVVMDNAQIGEGAWVAAGSVVSPKMTIPPGMLARGCPAKVVRPVRAEEQEWARGAILRYLDLARKHRAAQAQS